MLRLWTFCCYFVTFVHRDLDALCTMNMSYRRDANIDIQKIGRIQTKNKEVFKITHNFNGTNLARNREGAK